ncbi:Gfo/Idh/MocA family oxidoreductase [Catenulispora subtropica]|uniref:Gfo/Idh/MocA family oxidoreductase n=1 Tax=Catenulispora subtropica TaxID=450798 RepID=A0ABN2RFH9_9ACTN
MGEPMRVGVVGAGNISHQYFRILSSLSPSPVEVVAVSDRDLPRALAAVEVMPGARAVPVDELLAADDIDVVLNLTTPEAHAEVALAALASGKHVYGEKPLAANLADSTVVIDAGRKAGLRVGCAPDTVLGTGIQTARKIVDGGTIGTPMSATAVMACFGHELWHPDPEFYYRPGAGPLLDMGPYYLSALIHLLGPVKSVMGAGSRLRPIRTIASGPRAGTVFQTEVDTHVTGILEHESGALTTLIMTFDVAATKASNIEVHGTAGSLIVPDPNVFDGECKLWRAGHTGWSTVSPAAGFAGAGRGYGLTEMAQAIAEGRPHRASADLAYHVVDCAYTLLESAAERTTLSVESRCEVPPLVPLTGCSSRGK